jgi:hypothetical protein
MTLMIGVELGGGGAFSGMASADAAPKLAIMAVAMSVFIETPLLWLKLLTHAVHHTVALIATAGPILLRHNNVAIAPTRSSAAVVTLLQSFAGRFRRCS